MDRSTIGQVAKLAGVSHHTIRLYERYGLIQEAPRAANGYRQYPKDTVARLKFILRAKDMGFTLKEIGELLAIRQTSRSTCDDVRKQAEKKLQHILLKIQELKKLNTALSTLIAICKTHDLNDPCPILTFLEQADYLEYSS